MPLTQEDEMSEPTFSLYRQGQGASILLHRSLRDRERVLHYIYLFLGLHYIYIGAGVIYLTPLWMDNHNHSAIPHFFPLPAEIDY
uniref:Uncharacterized protein n=1 Tax=Picea glauca TaxID=3330 RepID=A0A117NFR1_PICGL|nr:hypothetical protein ABT39_MTgene2410 [Picea glauca]QHR86759.1 hypothetical protein Q903MT_gene763 [Picea sitchensis]